jgi:hypothetical protein
MNGEGTRHTEQFRTTCSNVLVENRSLVRMFSDLADVSMVLSIVGPKVNYFTCKWKRPPYQFTCNSLFSICELMYIRIDEIAILLTYLDSECQEINNILYANIFALRTTVVYYHASHVML